MRARLALRVLSLLLALIMLPLAFARATHGPTAAQVVAVAQQFGMVCTADATQTDCVEQAGSDFPSRHAVTRPPSGSLAEVATAVWAWSNGFAHDLLVEDRDWMTGLQVVGCTDLAGVRKFIDGMVALLGNSQTGGTYGPQTVAECSLYGVLDLQSRVGCTNVHGCYTVTGTILPGAFPTPQPTPPPTPPPVVTPPPAPTPTPTATPSPTTTPTIPTPTSSPSRTPRPSATPEQTVAGIAFEPQPSAPTPDIAGDPTAWAASVYGPAEVSTEPAAVGASAALAVLLLAFMGFIGELFNNTVKANYDEISGWWNKSWLGRLAARWAALWKTGP